jgi:hypothetical protein
VKDFNQMRCSMHHFNKILAMDSRPTWQAGQSRRKSE